VVFNLLASVEHYAEVHNIRGLDLGHAGRVSEAIEQYGQALRIKPDYVEAHYNLGIALEQTGEVQDAMRHYEQPLKIRPDLTEAREALARLQAGP
jgi:tetratricopeptide (TPR) repeat protein